MFHLIEEYPNILDDRGRIDLAKLSGSTLPDFIIRRNANQHDAFADFEAQCDVGSEVLWGEDDEDESPEYFLLPTFRSAHEVVRNRRDVVLYRLARSLLPLRAREFSQKALAERRGQLKLRSRTLHQGGEARAAEAMCEPFPSLRGRY